MAVERKYERDIDLMLAEEVSVSALFADWIVGKTRFKNREASVTDVYVSRADRDGESDLIVIYSNCEQRFALLIENKISARFMPSQRARYDVRARKGVLTGEYDEYEIILCSPRLYRESSQDAALFETWISYEDIAGQIKKLDASPRGIYRANFIETAAQRNANYWQRTADKVTDEFWRMLFEVAGAEFAILNMKENQKEKTKGNTWIAFHPEGFPRGLNAVGVRYKGSFGCVDLQFRNTDVRQLESKISGNLLPGSSCHQTAKAAVIRLPVPKLNLEEPLKTSLANARLALAAAAALAKYYLENRPRFDSLPG